MKKVLFIAVLAAAALQGRAVFADADDAKWVAQCVSDNKDAKVAIDVVAKYCVCMNNKMSGSERRSISEWEKTHETERLACDAEAGWK